MKAVPFVPLVGGISPESVGEVPGLEAVISYWTEGERTAEEWFAGMDEQWGTAGLVMRRSEEVLGFVVYGPPEFLPRARRYPLGPLDGDAPLLAYVGGDVRTQRHLLVRAIRDLRHRGYGRFEAIASDIGAPYHPPTKLLLDSGWRPVRRGWYRRRPYTLACTDLSSVVEVGEIARGIIGRVKLPVLKTPKPSPGTFARMTREAPPIKGVEQRS